MAWIFVPPGFFMQNLLMHAEPIPDKGEFYLPLGDGKVSWIDARDIAAVAVTALIEPGHGNRAYPLTGPEALTGGEVPATLSEVLGRPVRYVPDHARPREAGDDARWNTGSAGGRNERAECTCTDWPRGRGARHGRNSHRPPGTQSQTICKRPCRSLREGVRTVASGSCRLGRSLSHRRDSQLEAVVAQDAERVNRALLSAPRSAADVPRQLKAFLVDLAAFLSGPGHRRYVQVLAHLRPTARHARLIWQRGPERADVMLASFLQAAQAAGHLHCSAPADSAELVLGIALGLDLVRSMYRMPPAPLRPHARHAHSTQVVDLLMRLQVLDGGGQVGSAVAR